MISQRLTQKQQQRILPQQIQLLNIYHLTNLELETLIQKELEENPMLEESDQETENQKDTESQTAPDFADWEEFGYDDMPDYKSEYANFFSDNRMPFEALPQQGNFRERLKQQCHFAELDGQEYNIADYIIDSLNDEGMLDQPVAVIAEEISFKYKSWFEDEEILKVLKLIQSFDPPGIGATSIQECLILQLKRLPTDKLNNLAIRLLEEFYEDLRNRQFEKIKSAMQIDNEVFKDVLERIKTLKLKPVMEVGEEVKKNYVVPDFQITITDADIEVSLFKQRSATLGINYSWMDSIRQQCGSKDNAADHYMKNKLQSAEWFISALKQRESNMLSIMRSIVKWQREYFQTGDKMALKPMILKNIAEEVGVDISTVSRITSHKYASTWFGNILLKDLFSEGIAGADGKKINSLVIQEALSQVIEKEDKRCPFTDYQLVAKLAERGYKIARRTVTKYREMLSIPAAQVRAALNLG
jgi:RNA polymerase sigma-54 factor